VEKLPYIGQLDYPITVEREQTVRSTTGEQRVSSYQVIANLKSAIKRQNGKDDVEGKVRSLIDRSYVVRYRPELLEDTDTLIVRDRNEKYRVYNVIEIKRRRYLEILVTQYE
jgi:head-tail adaptor